MSLSRFKSNDCCEISQKHCPCIEFVLSGEETYGFHASQLLSYRLEVGSDEPPEKLVLAFSTADILLTGWRLSLIADHLREGDLLAVRPSTSKPAKSTSFSSRYANVEPSKCLVASIIVTPILKK